MVDCEQPDIVATGVHMGAIDGAVYGATLGQQGLKCGENLADGEFLGPFQLGSRDAVLVTDPTDHRRSEWLAVRTALARVVENFGNLFVIILLGQLTHLLNTLARITDSVGHLRW